MADSMESCKALDIDIMVAIFREMNFSREFKAVRYEITDLEKNQVEILEDLIDSHRDWRKAGELVGHWRCAVS